ncbi:unnamed protein product [Leptidea sinapis]|uniref:Endonuclease/exonuclease/phosphatase domain-containing protein n=1 Tax=Leptidea sinapis TaxID=189913 RepID=A0A5E4R6P5_9NEOP|nr:unnamed protein product [Leptidea sinapis]
MNCQIPLRLQSAHTVTVNSTTGNVTTENEDGNTAMQNEETLPSNTSWAPKRSKKNNGDDLIGRELVGALNRNLERKSVEDDEDRLFFLSLVKEFKKIPEHMQMQSKFDILKMRKFSIIRTLIIQDLILTGDIKRHIILVIVPILTYTNFSEVGRGNTHHGYQTAQYSGSNVYMQPVQSSEFGRDTSQEIVRSPTNAQSPISTQSEKSQDNNNDMHTEHRAHRRGGGVIVYIHNSLSFTRHTIPTCYFECIIGEIETSYKTRLGLCAVYRPPNLNKPLFIQEIKRIVELYPSEKSYILIGDMNINLCDHNPIRNQYWDSMRAICNTFAYGFEDNLKNICSTCNIQLLHGGSYCQEPTVSMRLKKATKDVIFKILHQLNKKKRPGIDNIRVRDLLCISSEIAPGSILGPTEYLTYVNEMCDIFTRGSVYQFADDTCLVTHGQRVPLMSCLDYPTNPNPSPPSPPREPTDYVAIMQKECWNVAISHNY